jgi:hypothetical protein
MIEKKFDFSETYVALGGGERSLSYNSRRIEMSFLGEE